MLDRILLIIEVLLNRNAREDERDDAAMDLGNYDDDRALSALIKVATDPSENSEMILNSCGESIASIFLKKEVRMQSIIHTLLPIARDGALAVIKSQKQRKENEKETSV